MSNVRQITIAVMIFQSEHKDDWPNNLGDLEPYLESINRAVLVNPREGCRGYKLEAPTSRIDEIKHPWKYPIVFEVRDDGTVMRDSGVIGYADGHVEYIREDE